MSVRDKLIAAGALFLAWGACVAYDPSLMSGFVTALRDALIALGVFQVTLADPKGQ